MRTVHNLNRRPNPRLEPIPSPSIAKAHTEAYLGSKALLNEINALGYEPDRPRRLLTHDEQVALVEQGKAQLLHWPPRMPDPEGTLGGVVGEL